jgi:hypothetical protein
MKINKINEKLIIFKNKCLFMKNKIKEINYFNNNKIYLLQLFFKK